jgi:protoporphyrinogen oxidase
MEIPGVVEFSNLRSFSGQHIIFVPFYMPVSHARFSRSDSEIISESFGYLRLLNPRLQSDDLLASNVSRLRYAQPICQPGYLNRIPPVQSSIRGLQIADTSTYYPEDRGVSESVRLAKEMAERIR